MYGLYFFKGWLVFIGIPLIIAFWAQFRVKSAFAKYSCVRVSSNMTGADTARAILQAAQIHDVEVIEINGFLGDHYDPTSKRLCLSSQTYRTPSVAAVGVAAHETGHAIQHAKAYAPLQARMLVVPATQIASNALPFIFFGSFFLPFMGLALIKLGVVCYLIITLFQLVTLPVEFDASRRAKIILKEMNVIQPGEEAAGVRSVLDAAALTYVAAFVAALGNLLYFLSLTQRRN